MWHPDTTTNAFTRAEYEDMSKAINSAYDIKDAATLNAIEKHGKSYREHLHPQAPLPMVGGQPYQPEEPTADELRARAGFVKNAQYTWTTVSHGKGGGGGSGGGNGGSSGARL